MISDQPFACFSCWNHNEKQQIAFGAIMAKACQDKNSVIYLQGNLGAGKTTLARAFLNALGYTGKVKSPTYSLIETYALKNHTVLHIDLYRIDNPDEIFMLNLTETISYQHCPVICLIEWAEKGPQALPPPDIVCDINVMKKGRCCTLYARTMQGDNIINRIQDFL